MIKDYYLIAAIAVSVSFLIVLLMSQISTDTIERGHFINLTGHNFTRHTTAVHANVTSHYFGHCLLHRYLVHGKCVR
jgi:hypothetical protein